MLKKTFFSLTFILTTSLLANPNAFLERIQSTKVSSLTPEKLEKILIKGETTKEEVLSELGRPLSIKSAGNDIENIIYVSNISYDYNREGGIFSSAPLTANNSANTFIVSIKNGVVYDYTGSRNSNKSVVNPQNPENNTHIANITKEELSEEIIKGETTKEDLISMFGEPTVEQINEDGYEIIGYQYGEASAISFSAFGGISGKGEARVKQLIFRLKNEIVIDYKVPDKSQRFYR